MQRKVLLDLKKWYESCDRKPLIVRGARQVGKSTAVQLFCDLNKIKLIKINLEKTKLKSVQNDQDNINLEKILDEIYFFNNFDVYQNKDTPFLIFLDEIQEQPKLLNILRYFYEDLPKIAVIAAGSLLEFALKKERFSFPVGRIDFYYLGQMSFYEFLEALDEKLLLARLLDYKISIAVHEKAVELYRQYLIVGGMPAVVKQFIKTKNLKECRKIQVQILATYEADFPKYNKRINVQRIEKIFSSLRHHIGQKVIYKNYDEDSKSRDIKKCLELLIDAKVALPTFHSEAGLMPLNAGVDERIFKLYYLDVGLLCAAMKIEKNDLDSGSTALSIYSGMLSEQFVAQHLQYIYGTEYKPNLNYWLRDKGTQKGEVDFLVELGRGIIPIEVKSDVGGKLKSLFYFKKEKKWPEAIKLSLSLPQTKTIKHRLQDEDVFVILHEVPIYCVEDLVQIKQKLTHYPN